MINTQARIKSENFPDGKVDRQHSRPREFGGLVPLMMSSDEKHVTTTVRVIQWHSVAFSGIQWHSVAFSGIQWHSLTLYHHDRET
jgi:hypothetical protein